MLLPKMIDAFLKMLDNIEYGGLSLTDPNGRQFHFKGRQDGPNADVQIHDYETLRAMAIRGDVGLADTYQTKKWDSNDLITLVEFFFKNEKIITAQKIPNALWSMFARSIYKFQANTQRGSRRNIRAHYDLGNAFYKLWLDKSMTYSSALFKSAGDSLFTAQQNKYDRILSKLGEKTGRVLEVGCGWGGFIERSANQKDYHIDGITLSNEQYEYAQKRLQHKNHQAKFHIKDYRDCEGKYDAIVSIEMFEAVGERYWPTYFAKIKSLLATHGTAMIQAITIDESRFEAYRKSTDMIRSYIFPGGMLVSFARFKQEATKAGLKVNDNFAFGKDYARTLASWLKQFDDKREEIKNLNFDDAFIRLWRFYLASCSGSFATGNTNVRQIELKHQTY